MGKRELIIAFAFIVVGVAAYHLTAPPPKAGEQGFSLSRFFDNARRGIRRNSAQESFVSTGTIPLRVSQDELRVSGYNRGIRIIGEDRSDVAYELSAASNGPDPASALTYAKQVKIAQDDLGNSLSLRLTYPRDATQTASLILRIPTRMTVRLEAGGGAYASKVAAVDLQGASGDVTILDIAGSVTGRHANGDLRVVGAGVVKLSLQGSRAKFERIDRGLTLDARNGELSIIGSKGPVELDSRNAEVTITDHAGPIRASGSGGRITIDAPHGETHVDMRSAEVEVTLTLPVTVMLLTTENTLRLFLDDQANISVDAVVTEGQIQAGDFNLHADAGDREMRLAHTFGTGTARVTLRNSRGEIVIRKTK